MRTSHMNRSFFLLFILCCSFTLASCSQEDSAPAEEAPEIAEAQPESAPEPVPEPEPTADLPEVIVLHGRNDFIPWLESENWWGDANRDEPQLMVPHVIITAINPSWKEYSASLTVQVKKELFYRMMLPLVMHANWMVSNFRDGLLEANAV